MRKQTLTLMGLLLLYAASLQSQPPQVKDIAGNTVTNVKLSTGISLQCVEQGSQSGIPVILLHGLADSWHSWELVLPHLPNELHVYALTQRGHGDAERPFYGYDPKDFAADVAAFMDARGIDKAVIVGHSMGSMVTQQFAIVYPRKTLGIVLMGTFASFNDNEAIKGFQQLLDTLNDPINEQFAEAFQQSTLANPVPDDFLRTVIMESRKVPSRVWKSTAAALLNANYLEALKQYQQPALIIWGDKDLLCPREDQDEVAMALKQSQLIIYTGTGHAIHWEEPQKLAQDLVVFTNRLKIQ